MQAEYRNKQYYAWAASAGLHAAVFLLAGACGLFAPTVLQHPPQTVDVVLYDVSGGSGGGGGGGGSPAPLAGQKSAPQPQQAAEDITVAQPQAAAQSADTLVLQDTAEATQTPASEAQAVATQTEAGSSAAGSPDGVAGGTGEGGSGTGSGGGNGSGIGTGNGSGVGPGSGSGTGGGNGSGIGNGDGDGSALRPKTPPRLLQAVAPHYPESLRRRDIEGSVRVRLIVASDGSVESAEVSESSGYDEMDAAAVEAAYSYSFLPAENAMGDPVRCALSTTVHFELR